MKVVFALLVILSSAYGQCRGPGCAAPPGPIVAPVTWDGTTWVSASAAGDPHYTTFDGRFHDTMVSGLFTVVKNKLVNVQAYAMACNGPANTHIRCNRQVYIRLTPTDTEALTIVYGVSWGDSSVITSLIPDPVVINEVGGRNATVKVPCNANENGGVAKSPCRNFNSLYPSTTTTWLNGKYVISMNEATSELSIGTAAAFEKNDGVAFRATIGRYFLSIGLPTSTNHKTNTNGLLGFYDGLASNDFGFTFNGAASNVPPGTGRLNDGSVQNWASTFSAGTISNPAIVNGPYPIKNGVVTFGKDLKTHLMQTAVDNSAGNSVPDASALSDIFKVNFATLQDAQDASTICSGLIADTKSEVFKNCMMDAAINPQLAKSNSDAAAASQANSAPSSSTSNTIAGLDPGTFIAVIVVSSVLFLSMVTIGYLYWRNHKLKEEVDQYALMIHPTANGASTSSSSVAIEL